MRFWASVSDTVVLILVHRYDYTKKSFGTVFLFCIAS